MLATALCQHFERVGLAARVVPDGTNAVEQVRAWAPDAVVLDGNLPGKDGFEICREIRPWFRGAIVMLTSRNDDMDRILGLDLGADDYLVKPVRPQVATAHIKACLRRVTEPQTADGEDVIAYGRFCINRASRTATLGDDEIDLTTAEFDLLWLLAERAGSILTRDDIMAGMRGIEHDGIDRSIDMRISRLRRRLDDDPEQPRLIKTVRGKGYLFSKTGWQ